MLKIFPLVCDLSTAVIPVLRRPGQIILFCVQLPCCLIIFLWSISHKNCSCPIHLQYLGGKHFKYLLTRVKLSPIDYSICMTFMFLAKCKIHVSRTTSKCIKQCKKKTFEVQWCRSKTTCFKISFSKENFNNSSTTLTVMVKFSIDEFAWQVWFKTYR